MSPNLKADLIWKRMKGEEEEFLNEKEYGI